MVRAETTLSKRCVLSFFFFSAPAKRMRGIKRKRTKLPHRARAEDSDDADDSVQSAKAKTGNSGKVKQDHHSESRGFMATISKIGKNLGYMVSNFLTGQYFEVFWNFYYIGRAVLQFLHIMS